MYGGIEAGGTKFVCAVSDGGEILEKLSIPTTTPEETLDQVFEFFDRYELKESGLAHSARLVSTKQKIITDTFWQLPKKGGHNSIFLAQSRNATIFLLLGQRMSMLLHMGN